MSPAQHNRACNARVLEVAPLHHSQAVRRSPAFGTRGMVASTQPLATEGDGANCLTISISLHLF
eukprot:SAG11_NODE_16897_length_534_cov_0.818391_1_plen_64_part_00